jgi:hypothetical protein
VHLLKVVILKEELLPVNRLHSEARLLILVKLIPVKSNRLLKKLLQSQQFKLILL